MPLTDVTPVYLYWVPQPEASTARWVAWSAGNRVLGTPGPPCGALAPSPGEVRVATPQSWRLAGPATDGWFRDSPHRNEVLLVSAEPLPEFLGRYRLTMPMLYDGSTPCAGAACAACAWLAGVDLPEVRTHRGPSSRLPAMQRA